MPICLKCKQEITGGAYVSLSDDVNYHSNHFTCQACDIELGGIGFFEHENGFYCEKDYNERFGNKCAKCHGLIKGEFTTFDGQNYHDACFVCTLCSKPFPDGKFVRKDSKPYCKECSLQAGPKCDVCKNPLSGKIVKALDKTMHIECYKCAKCQKPFDGNPAVPYEGNPYHKECILEIASVMCAECSKPISGVFYKVDGKNYHKECHKGTTRPTTSDTVKKDEPNPVKKDEVNPVKKEEVHPIKKEEVHPVKKDESNPKAWIKTESKIKIVEHPKEETKVETRKSDTKHVFIGLEANYTYHQLITRPFPEGIDVSKRETYLTKGEFNKIFQMPYEEFLKLPKWKQDEKKKKVKLF